MSDPNQAPVDPQIYGPITTSQADVLRTVPVHGFEPGNPDHEAAQVRADGILQKIGSLAGGPNTVALVVATDEQGAEVPSHYVALDPNDLGTELEAVAIERKGLPDPATALEKLKFEERMRQEEAAATSPAVRGPQTAAERQMDLAAAERANLGQAGLPEKPINI